jgi:hypothetical protein
MSTLTELRAAIELKEYELETLRHKLGRLDCPATVRVPRFTKPAISTSVAPTKPTADPFAALIAGIFSGAPKAPRRDYARLDDGLPIDPERASQMKIRFGRNSWTTTRDLDRCMQGPLKRPSRPGRGILKTPVEADVESTRAHLRYGFSRNPRFMDVLAEATLYAYMIGDLQMAFELTVLNDFTPAAKYKDIRTFHRRHKSLRFPVTEEVRGNISNRAWRLIQRGEVVEGLRETGLRATSRGDSHLQMCLASTYTDPKQVTQLLIPYISLRSQRPPIKARK